MKQEQFLPIVEDVKKYSISELLDYFGDNPSECLRLLNFSYDKRFTPSTFIEENGDEFRVGWYDDDYHDVKVHKTIKSAVVDFVLFSLNRGRFSE